MPDITAEDAVQALAAAWEEDSPTQPEAPERPVAPSEDSTQSNQDGEKPSGLFYDVDPSTLTPELRTMFDGMQKAFTQKNQEIAEQRRQLESFGGLDQVQQAVEFVQSLNDPQNLVQLHTELSQYLQEAGYTKAEADAAASGAIQQQPEPAEQDYGFADPEVARLERELADIKAWREQFEEQQELSRMELEIERMENALRTDRGYDDSDISRIYQLSYAYGADLNAAANAYDEMKTAFITDYVNRKAEAPGPGQAPPIGTFGQKPESFGADLNAAHRYAKALAIAAQNNGEFDN